MTESGKTTLAKKLANSYREKGVGVIVLDPMQDKWPADYQTTDEFEFMRIAKQSVQCALFIDESGATVGRYNEPMFWLATRARHYGHKSHFVTQRAVQINKTVRDQCSHLFAFCGSKADGKELANEFNKPELQDINTLPQFYCYYATRFGDLKKLHISP